MTIEPSPRGNLPKMRLLTSLTLALTMQGTASLAFGPADLDASSTWHYFEPQYHLPNVSCGASVGDEDFALGINFSAGGWRFEVMNFGWGAGAGRDWPTVELRAAGQQVSLSGSYDDATHTILFFPGEGATRDEQDFQMVVTVLNMLSAGSDVEVLVDSQSIGTFQLTGSSAALQQLVACGKELRSSWN